MNSTNPLYTLRQLKMWRGQVIALWNARCFVTQKHLNSGGEFEAHHLWCKSRYPELALDPKNGVLLSKDIHRRFHKQYSSVIATPDIFEQFLREEFNITHFPWRNPNHEKNAGYVEKRYKKSPEFFKLRLEETAETRGHIILYYDNAARDYENESTYVVVCCTKHGDTIERKTAKQYMHQKTGLFCCALEARRVSNTKRAAERKNRVRPQTPQERHDYVVNLIKGNNHIFEGCPNSEIPFLWNYDFPMVVSCKKHKKTYETTPFNYMRNSEGLPCCSSPLVSGRVRERINTLFRELKDFIRDNP